MKQSMKQEMSRRHFLGGMGACAIGAAAATPSADALVRSFSPAGVAADVRALISPRYPHTKLKFGYTAMTWGKEERQAIEDIAALGFSGIQFRDIAVKEFEPAEMRSILSQHGLTFVALSSGTVDIDPAVEKDQIAMHVANAQYVRDCGGLYLQVLDTLGTWPRSATPEECRRLGHLLNEIGKRTADLGIPLGYHNHLDTISQTPENLARVLAATDPRYVWLELDTAHYYDGGGDPAEAILRYHDRLLFLHIKDAVPEPMGTEKRQKYPFKFVELGRGRINFPAVFAALNQVRFQGWAVIELDHVPDKSITPKAAAEISKTYLEKQLDYSI